MNYDGSDPTPPRWMLGLCLACVAVLSVGALYACVVVRELMR